MPAGAGANCPVLRPTKAQFSRPFNTFVADYFRKNPNVPMVKVIPPAGYVPRKSQYPTDLIIEAPIEQRVLLHDNKPGYYDCVLLQQKPLTVEQFEQVARERGAPKQNRGNEDDELLERPFWSSITSRPPLYGADTPLSLFDDKLEFGWNLHSLGCLLSKYKVPKIPGVTTPMTYYGMWKSFFSWHVEDVDLLSINYLHFGASKVWYAIAPGENRQRFESFARTLYPNDAKSCSNFLRHKSCMITPKLIRDEGIPLVSVKQDAGEFIVLNAGAYHAGYNLGFNCAEAVNFATEDWIPLGQKATRCDCRAMGKDAVSVDMRLFPGWESSSSDSGTSEDDEDEEQVMSDEGSSNAPRRPPSKKSRTGHKHRAGAKRGPGRPCKPVPASASNSDSDNSRRQSSSSRDSRLKAKAGPMKVPGSQKAGPGKGLGKGGRADDSGKAGKRGSTIGKRMRATKEGRRWQASTSDALAENGGKKRKGRAVDAEDEPLAKKPRGQPKAQPKPMTSQGLQKVKRPRGRPRKALLPQAAAPPSTPQQAAPSAEQSSSALARGPGRPSSAGRPAPSAALAKEVTGQPYAVSGLHPDTGARYFCLVQRLSREAKPGSVAVRGLRELPSGLWGGTNQVWSEDEGALIRIRTQPMAAAAGTAYKLLTMRSKILGVDLED